MRANFIFSEVWIGLRRNLTMTIAVVVTVAIGMALLGVGLMISSQISSMRDFWTDKVEVSVFLCKKNDAFPQCKTSGGVNAQEQADLRGDHRGHAAGRGRSPSRTRPRPTRTSGPRTPTTPCCSRRSRSRTCPSRSG